MNLLNKIKNKVTKPTPESEALAQKNLYEHDAKCNTDIEALEAQVTKRRKDCVDGTAMLKTAIETAKSLEMKAMQDAQARLENDPKYRATANQIEELKQRLAQRKGELDAKPADGKESFFFAHARRRPMPRRIAMRRQAARGMGQLPFYCVRCKAKTTGAGVQRSQTRKGQPMLRAQCSRCGTRVVRFVAKDAL